MRKWRVLCAFAIALLLIHFGGNRSEGKQSIVPPDSLAADKPTLVRAVAFATSPSVAGVAPVLPDGAQDNIKAVTKEFTETSMPSPELSFDGLSNFDNLATYGLLILPPDPIGDVGPEHYVQAVNSLVRIYNKSGQALTPSFKFGKLFAPLGTVCALRNDGSPIILYDPLADRWLISQYCTAFPPFRQMIAISRSGDPTGSYFLYEFVMPNMRLNDFPKIGVWPDGYYMTTDEFIGSDYAGNGLFAFDRSNMLRGEASASYIYFNIPTHFPERLGSLLPADLDGMDPPPNGSPNIFAGYSATEYGDGMDAIRLFDFHADFADPERSTFTERLES
ncbi:MAG: hypothetical protein WBD22_08920, partial [Pyrinomonadaceae bacterium]